MEKKEQNEQLAKNLKWLLKRHKLSQLEAAKQIGLSYRTFVDYCRGYVTPGAGNLGLMAYYFGLTDKELYSQDVSELLPPINYDKMPKKKSPNERRGRKPKHPDSEKVVAWVKYRGFKARKKKLWNALDEFQEIVGGKLSSVTLNSDVAILYNDDSVDSENVVIGGKTFYGTIILVGIDKDTNIVDFPAETHSLKLMLPKLFEGK